MSGVSGWVSVPQRLMLVVNGCGRLSRYCAGLSVADNFLECPFWNVLLLTIKYLRVIYLLVIYRIDI
jgi:hypothetical protein